MANIAREGNEIVLKLSTGERIMAMRREVRDPAKSVMRSEAALACAAGRGHGGSDVRVAVQA